MFTTKNVVDKWQRSRRRPTKGIAARPASGSTSENKAVIDATALVGSIDRSIISDGVLLTTPTQGGARRERRTLLAGCYSTQLLIQRRDEKVDPEHVQHHRQREQATLHPTREVSPSQDFERALSNSTNVHECPRAQLRLEWVVPKVTQPNPECVLGVLLDAPTALTPCPRCERAA